MTTSKQSQNGDSLLIIEFIKNLEATADQVKNLLNEVRESEIDFAAVKNELRHLCEQVKELHATMSGQGGISLVTRIILLETKLQQYEKDLDKLIENKQEIEKAEINLKTVEKTGKWQTIVALVTGSLALVTVIITSIIELFK